MSNDVLNYLGDTLDVETGEFDIYKAKEVVSSRKSKINIILFGATGVGKSSLVNAVFGADVVKTGVGKPITQYLEKIHIEEKGLTLWDTKGIEAKDYELTREQLKADIYRGFNDAKNNKHESLPNIAWLCINERSKRVEEREFDLISLAHDFSIPIVVVFTQTMNEDGDDFFEVAKETINERYGKFIKERFVRVNSVEFRIAGHKIPVSGLQDLLDVTESCLQDSLESEEEREKHIEALLKAQEVNIQKKLDAMINSARSNVHTASLAAAAVGASPIPGSDAPLIAGIQSVMIYTLNSEFEVDAKDNNMTAFISGILSKTAIANVGRMAVSNILKFIPGAGTVVGGSISAATAATITEAIGRAYIKLLTSYFDKEVGKTVLPSKKVEMIQKFGELYSKKGLKNDVAL